MLMESNNKIQVDRTRQLMEEVDHQAVAQKISWILLILWKFD